MWRLPSCWRSSTLIDRAGALRSSGFYTLLGRASLTNLSSAVFRFAPLKRCAGSSGTRPYLPPVGHAHHGKHCCNTPVLGSPASIMGSELPRTGLRPFAQIETFVTLCGMVWVRAKVLGQMGWTTSPYLRAGALSCPSLAIYRAGVLWGSGLFALCPTPMPLSFLCT
jgi:hypothetical protein